MSSHLQWMVIRNNSAFLLKGAHGQTFSTERNNLKNLNSYRFNGLIHKKTVGVEESADKKGVVLVTRNQSGRNKPRKSLNRVSFQAHKGPRRILSKIRNTLGNKGYRKDLRTLALRRASALLAGQKPKAVNAAAAKKSTTTKKADK